MSEASPEDIEIVRALVKRILIAMTGLDREEAEQLVFAFEMQASIIQGMKGR